MSIASSSTASTSALRSVMRPRVISQSLARRAEGTRAETKPARQFAAAAYQRPLEAPEPPLSDTPASALPPSSSSSSSSSSSLRALEPTTPASAQSYLSDLLHLPPSHAFPQDLALQILTHKSYRYAHLIRSPHSVRRRSISPASDEEAGPSSVSHNARLSFLGRRAISTYLALFLHSHLRTDRGLRSADFLRGRALDEKLKAMTHVNNLGREVGSRWGVGDVMRWDRNETGLPGENIKIKGLTVESILGGVFTQHGSPTAHRAFHLHVLPHLSEQLRDPMLLERAEILREEVEREFGGGVVGS